MSGTVDPAELLRDVEALLAEAPHDRGAALDVVAGRLHAVAEGNRWTGILVRQDDELVLGAERGALTEGLRIPVGEGICGGAVAEGRAALVEEPDGGASEFPGPGTGGSGIVVPILLDGEAVGAVVVRSDAPGGFSQEERELIERVAERLADLV